MFWDCKSRSSASMESQGYDNELEKFHNLLLLVDTAMKVEKGVLSWDGEVLVPKCTKKEASEESWQPNNSDHLQQCNSDKGKKITVRFRGKFVFEHTLGEDTQRALIEKKRNNVGGDHTQKAIKKKKRNKGGEDTERALIEKKRNDVGEEDHARKALEKVKRNKVGEDTQRPPTEKKRKHEETPKKANKRAKTEQEPPEMAEELKKVIEEMGGSECTFVIQKKLFNSDVDRSSGRLSIPLEKSNVGFLTEEEETGLNQQEERAIVKKKEKPTRKKRDYMVIKKSLPVLLIEPSLKREFTPLELRKWNSGSLAYTLVHGWNQVVTRNKLQTGDIVQLWSFRVGSKLAFLLNALQA